MIFWERRRTSDNPRQPAAIAAEASAGRLATELLVQGLQVLGAGNIRVYPVRTTAEESASRS